MSIETTYCGKPISELSREEMIEAIMFLIERYNKMSRFKQKVLSGADILDCMMDEEQDGAP